MAIFSIGTNPIIKTASPSPAKVMIVPREIDRMQIAGYVCPAILNRRVKASLTGTKVRRLPSCYGGGPGTRSTK